MTFSRKFWNRDLLFACISGLIFLGVFWVAYRKIPDRFYKDRDDALITFSHAKNLAEFGIVGVNPSGGRVEGYSTPAQFILFFLVYKATRIPYAVFTIWQTFLCTFILGFTFVKFFKTNYVWGIFLSLVSALICVRDPSFLEWHGSGMENPIFHVLYLVSIYFLYKMVQEERIILSSVIFLFLASISRVESIYYVGPLLLVFAVIFTKQEGNAKGVVLALAVLFLWGVFNLFRYLYFGDFVPNTGFAHGLSVLKRIQSLLTLQPAVWRQSFGLMASIFSGHHGYLMIVTLPLISIIKKGKDIRFLFVLLAVFVFLTCLNPFIFDESSLDPSRTTTHLTVFAVLFGSFMIFNLRREKVRYAVLPLFGVAALAIIGDQGLKPYELNWSADDFQYFRTEIVRVQREHDIIRPTIGNPDLGLMSWHKDFNIIDLGRIGDPVIARLDNPRLIADYLFDFIAPDILEIHDAWSCHYSYLFKDPRFRDFYEPVKEERTDWLRIYCRQEKQVKTGIWIRKDIKRDSQSRERKLMDRLRYDPSIQAVKEELDFCSKDDRAISSLYVTRSVYRFLPEFTARGNLDEVRSLFKETKSSRYDLALLNGGNRADWYKDLIEILRDHSLHKIQDLLQTDGRIEIKRFPDKTGFYDDEIWTRGEVAFKDLGYVIPLGTKWLVIRTYGFRPDFLRTEERLRIRAFIDEIELKLDHVETILYYFQIPDFIKEIHGIRIVSSTFVPKDMGLNDDVRNLGLDIQAIEFR
jgi:hypothetical protein